MSCAILFQDTGELGNRLVSFSHLLAFGAEHRVPVVNLCFWRYARFFERADLFVDRPWSGNGSRDQNLARSPVETILRRGLETCAPRGLHERFSFDGDLVCEPKALLTRALSAAATRLFKGSAGTKAWKIRHERVWAHECSLLVSADLAEAPFLRSDLVVSHAELIRSEFRLVEPLRRQVDNFISSLKRDCDTLIGVHIRRGDYNRYRQGCWFYDDTVYRRVLRDVAALYPDRRVAFVLASNQPVSASVSEGLHAHSAPGHLALDLYALAECDLIVGPPSSFSGWASFIGRKPIYFIENADCAPNLADLREIWQPRFY